MDEVQYRRVEKALWSYLNVAPTEHMVPLAAAGSEVRVAGGRWRAARSLPSWRRSEWGVLGEPGSRTSPVSLPPG